MRIIPIIPLPVEGMVLPSVCTILASYTNCLLASKAVFGIHYNLLDYLDLVDWTGRQIRKDKRDAIDNNAPPILKRIGIAPEHWIELCTNFEDRFKKATRGQVLHMPHSPDSKV